MIYKMYSVYDAKIGAYMQPFFLRNKGEAIRSWEEVVNDGQSAFSKFPADFTLFEIGEFDDNSGDFAMYPAKISLGLAVEFKKDSKSQAPLLDIIKDKKEA